MTSQILNDRFRFTDPIFGAFSTKGKTPMSREVDRIGFSFFILQKHLGKHCLDNNGKDLTGNLKTPLLIRISCKVLLSWIKMLFYQHRLNLLNKLKSLLKGKL